MNSATMDIAKAYSMSIKSLGGVHSSSIAQLE
jgi:hypothetical protein